MQQHDDLLVEIGTEELPPGALWTLAQAFRDAMVRGLDEQRLTHGAAEAFAAPRRLTVRVGGVALRQPDQVSVRRGPALAAAFDAAGQPSRAAAGFAQSCGVAVEALEREETDKGRWLVFRQAQAGAAAHGLMPGLIAQALAALPIPRRMRWGDGDEGFVRPVHWICALLGESALEGRLFGIDIGRDSRGHRFHHPEPVPIPRPADYLQRLLSARVMADFGARRDEIARQVGALAATTGGEAAIGAALLDEVTALCEWPVAQLGRFDEGFLAVPPEVLIETMQKNQKYFPVLDASGALMPRFVFVANLESRNPDLVTAGNERVIRPRFADARFFWEQDRKTSLESRVGALDAIVFQHKLGSMGAKARRISALAAGIAAELGEDTALAARAGLLAKADLVTHMVGEFPSLQGTMGRYYAAADGEDAGVVAAMEEHWLPRQAGDRLPASACGRAVALADKLDSLVGVFAIGERPTGVKDPYGLRRASIGVLRILIETPLPLDLHALLQQAAAGYAGQVETNVEPVFEYLLERLPGWYADRGIAGDTVAAVLAVRPTVPADIDRRIAAVAGFRTLAAADALSSANKRIRNLLRKAGGGGTQAIDPALLVEPAEQALATKLGQLERTLAPLLAAADYAGVLQVLAGLREEVDRFFDAVMVMAEEPSLRANRLAILAAVERLFLRVADISLLQQPGSDA